MSKPDKAVSTFLSGFNCAQAILSTWAPELGVDEKTALRLATGVGAGISRMGETCGAVTGAILVLGLKHGRDRLEAEEAKEKTYALAQKFVSEFRRRNGSIGCKELLGFDISTPEGLQAIREKGLEKTVCANLVRNAAEILESLL
jgi:C_GCAxxG_C_C family probable redox protein